VYRVILGGIKVGTVNEQRQGITMAVVSERGVERAKKYYYGAKNDKKREKKELNTDISLAVSRKTSNLPAGQFVGIGA